MMTPLRPLKNLAALLLLFTLATTTAQTTRVLNRADGVELRSPSDAAGTDQLVTVNVTSNKMAVAGSLTVADIENAVGKTITGFTVGNQNSTGTTKIITLTYEDGTTQTATFTDLRLTEAEVDAFVSDNGYLTNELDPTVGSHIKGIAFQDIQDWNAAFDKKAVAISVTGDANKTITLTREDGTVLTASFNDIDTQSPDDVINTLQFNISNGVLTAITSENMPITATLDGRFSLLNHTHDLEDITDFDGNAFATSAQGDLADEAHSWGDHSVVGYLTNTSGDARYLRLIGGNLTGNVASTGSFVVNNNSSSVIGFRKNTSFNESSGGWAREFLAYENTNASTHGFSVFLFGSNTEYRYASIGFGSFNDVETLKFYPNGNITIGGNQQPTEKVDVNGNVKADNFIGSGSDLSNIVIIDESTISNADTLNKEGRYKTVATFIGSPYNGSSGENQGYLTHYNWLNNNSLFQYQTFVGINSNFDFLIRRKNNGVWSSWKNIWHEGNFTPPDYAPDTPWANLTLTAGLTGQIRYKRKNGRIIITGSVNNQSGNEITDLGQLPTGFRPSINTRIIMSSNNVLKSGLIFAGRILFALQDNENAEIYEEITLDTSD